MQKELCRCFEVRSEIEKETSIYTNQIKLGGLNMSVSKEELLHIADLSDLILKEDEVEIYLKNFQEIIDFANTINNANVEELDATIAANEAKNRFRKDEIKEFGNVEGMIANGKDIEQNMFKLPKVVQ